jgi:NADPH2:quinone reductase
MGAAIPAEMRAAAIDRFGGPEVIRVQVLPVPRLRASEVLIRLDTAGVGIRDPEVRSGEVALDGDGRFPKILGNDGAGTVVAIGDATKRFQPGDRVYAYTMRGGFYAEYVAVDENEVALIPPGVGGDEAGALGADGITALRGLDDQLRLRAADTLMIYGASGGIGHLAIQLAKRIGARVLAVASGADDVALSRHLGADRAVDGRHDDVRAAARAFAPGGIDAALVLVGGDGANAALKALGARGRVAYPNGVEPPPFAPEGVSVLAYDGTPAREAFERLNHLIGPDPFHVELGRVFALDEAADAHRALARHHLGKLVLKVHRTIGAGQTPANHS